MWWEGGREGSKIVLSLYLMARGEEGCVVIVIVFVRSFLVMLWNRDKEVMIY